MTEPDFGLSTQILSVHSFVTSMPGSKYTGEQDIRSSWPQQIYNLEKKTILELECGRRCDPERFEASGKGASLPVPQAGCHPQRP